MKVRCARLLTQVDVLSLDVFDTVLGRRCARPDDVFTLLEDDLVASHGPAFVGFAQARRTVDSRARRLAWDERQAEEISLDDIYRLLCADHPVWPLLASQLAALEMQLERALLYPLPFARDLIATARTAGKRVILVSDMYLPEAFCRAVLADNGVTGFDAFFLSSTVGKLKHTGALFAHVVAELGVPPHRILHVGDNPHSDGVMAKQAGLRSLIIPKALDVLERLPANPWSAVAARGTLSGRESLLVGMSASGALGEDRMADPFWYRIGYQFGGPLIYGYVQHILAQLRGRDIPRLYFLARDGYILKQVYDKLAAGDPAYPPSTYLYASRRALNFASISQLDERSENWLVEGIRLTVGDFLRRVSLDPARFAAQIAACGFRGAEQPVVEGADYTNLRRLFRSIEPELVAAAAAERAAYTAYLQSKGVLDTGPAPLVLVDVGWMTSIQHSFAKLLAPLRPELQIEGFYLGTYPEARARLTERSLHHHYLMAYGDPPATMASIRHCVCLLEFFFAAPEHTFIRMRQASDGRLSPEFAHFHENQADLPALAAIHGGVIDYVEGLHNAAPAGIVIQPAEVMALLHRLLAAPTKLEAERLGNLHYADGYGSYFDHTRMAIPSGLRRLGLNKAAWKREFRLSHWPAGYAARLSRLERTLLKWLHPSAKYSKPHG
jgi:HAD superfamily hydrolase (TIGR01549 family)